MKTWLLFLLGGFLFVDLFDDDTLGVDEIQDWCDERIADYLN